jgi:hypothetical protein
MSDDVAGDAWSDAPVRDCPGQVILPTEVVSTVVVYWCYHKRCKLITQDGTRIIGSGR